MKFTALLQVPWYVQENLFHLLQALGLSCRGMCLLESDLLVREALLGYNSILKVSNSPPENH